MIPVYNLVYRSAKVDYSNAANMHKYYFTCRVIRLAHAVSKLRSVCATAFLYWS